MSKKVKKVYVLHYAGRGTPEANEIEGIFETEEALIKSLLDEYDSEQEVRDMLDECEYLYMSSYTVQR
jgi:hypothetical protein